MVLGLCLAGPSRADDKGKKEPQKGKDDRTVIVIQLDLSKAPPGFVKQLMELAKGKDDGKKSGKNDEDNDEKKGNKNKKGYKDEKKGEDKKSNIVQVDLNKLPAGLAKRLKAELAKGKNDGKKNSKKDEDEDEKGGKKKAKKGDEDNDKKGNKKKTKKDEDDD